MAYPILVVPNVDFLAAIAIADQNAMRVIRERTACYRISADVSAGGFAIAQATDKNPAAILGRRVVVGPLVGHLVLFHNIRLHVILPFRCVLCAPCNIFSLLRESPR